MIMNVNAWKIMRRMQTLLHVKQQLVNVLMEIVLNVQLKTTVKPVMQILNA